MSIFLWSGDKGGSGKSFGSEAFTDWLIARRHLKPLVVDTDMRNPDVHRMFSGVTDAVLINLREREGWFELVSVAHEAGERPVVVSLPGNIGDAIETNVLALTEALADLKQDLIMFWVLNREPDAINLLRVALSAYGKSVKRTVAVRNLHWGAPPQFVRWNESKTRETLLKDGGLEIDLDDLHDSLVDATKRALPNAFRFSQFEAVRDPRNPEQGLRFGQKAELKRWTERTFHTFDTIASKISIEANRRAQEPSTPRVA